jgi:hypothetical protein
VPESTVSRSALVSCQSSLPYFCYFRGHSALICALHCPGLNRCQSCLRLDYYWNRYCSKLCQKKDWSLHKVECKSTKKQVTLVPLNTDQAAQIGVILPRGCRLSRPPGLQAEQTFWVKVQSFYGETVPSPSKHALRVYDKSRTCDFVTNSRTPAHATVAAVMERSAVVGHLGGRNMYFLAKIKTEGALDIFVNQSATTMPW